MIKNNSKIKIIIFLLLILLIPNCSVFALESNGGGGPSPSPSSGGGGCKSGCCGSAAYCSYGLNWTWHISAHFDIYDPTTGTIATYVGDGYDPNTLKDKYFTAGRYVGVDAYEEVKYVINITGVEGHSGVTKGWDTSHACTIPASYSNGEVIPSKIKAKAGSGSGSAPASSGWNPTPKPQLPQCQCVTTGSIPAPSNKTCFNEAYGKAVAALGLNSTNNGIEPMYYAKRLDINDINNTALIDVKETYTSNYEYTPAKVNGQKITGMNSDLLNSISNLTITITIRIKYNVGNACINVKTGLISYKDTCDSEELSVPDIYSRDVTNLNESQKKAYRIGQYFIPLNTKENSDFTYSLKARRKDNEEVCKSYIDHAKDMDEVRNTIMYVNASGNPTAIPANINNKNSAKGLMSKGCYLATTAKFKVKQQFYNENASNKLEGYGFYYRPIDVSNPFPNGLKDSGYWGMEGLYNANENSVTIDKKTYDLDDSFKEETYKANINNPNTIREYNKRADSEGKSYLYMSWDNMKVDGSSGFIDSGYVTRNGKQSYYKLGCGPSNNTWKECDG